MANYKKYIGSNQLVMKDDDCISFLQWALPQLSMRWPGFRKVRGQVCKRLARRLEELQLPNLQSYRNYLEENPLEWHILDVLCRITISRFYRDRETFFLLQTKVFPELISLLKEQHEKDLSCWCIGSASGEEPYSLSLLWELSGPQTKGLDLKILATEVDQQMINRARQGAYQASSLREVGNHLKDEAFIQYKGDYYLRNKYKKRVDFLQQDIRDEQPDESFHLILCRNLVFTYFTLELQEEIAARIMQLLKPDGFLVIGVHEKLPVTLPGLIPWQSGQTIYRKIIEN
jgi:chemotaxis protein methyltransferase CheR